MDLEVNTRRGERGRERERERERGRERGREGERERDREEGVCVWSSWHQWLVVFNTPESRLASFSSTLSLIHPSPSPPLIHPSPSPPLPPPLSPHPLPPLFFIPPPLLSPSLLPPLHPLVPLPLFQCRYRQGSVVGEEEERERDGTTAW